MKPTRKSDLFILTGASGVGKSTAAEVLFQKEKDYIVLEGDLLWHDMYNEPDTNYRKYRELWLNMCGNISQIGLPIVLCGCGVPEQFEICDARKYFTNIYYIAVVSTSDILEDRMRRGRNISDENWIKSSIDFNAWLKANASKTNPIIEIVDSTNRTEYEVADEIEKIIRKFVL